MIVRLCHTGVLNTCQVTETFQRLHDDDDDGPIRLNAMISSDNIRPLLENSHGVTVLNPAPASWGCR